MATYTPNLNLKKPTGNEYYDVVAEDNDAKDKIDAETGRLRMQLLEVGTNKVDRNGASQVTLAMLSQEAKEAMTGGSVAVVGKNMVNRDNILEGQVTHEKTDIITVASNKFNVSDLNNIVGSFLSANEVLNADATTGASHYIVVKAGDKVRFTKTGSLFGPTTGGVIIGGCIYNSARTYLTQINEANTIALATYYELTVPAGGAYIKFNYRSAYNNMCVINEVYPTLFKQYSAVIKDKFLAELDGIKIKNESITEEKISFIQVGVNKFNVNDAGNLVGFYVSNSNVNSTESTSGISHFIKVNAGDKVRFTKTGSLFGATDATQIIGGSIFNETKDYVGAISGSNCVALATYYELTVPVGVYYIKFNYRTTANNMCLINTAYPTGFRSFKRTLSKNVKLPLDPTFLKHMLRSSLCIGDSLTKGAYYDPIKNGSAVPENYPYYLSKLTDWTVANAGQSGYTTIQWYDNLSAQITSAYDSFIICLGTNGGLTDTIDADTVGTNYTQYANTNTGSYCKIIEKIKAANPKAYIYLTDIYATSGSLATTNSVIKKIATKYNLSVISIMESFGDEVMHPFGNTVHFGKVGNIHLAKTILNGITQDMLDNPTKYEVLLF